ncbi:MAG: rhomboid family intramembrane serine protease [Rhodobacteraceae bacterium]|nr:rhomboid family intramembrane serine protease [Paracoccaceae bacterium]
MRWPKPVLLVLILAVALPELVLTLADNELIGSTRWRSISYQNGAFWTGILRDWQVNFAAQPTVMFATYSFLHTDMLHMLGNIVALFWLGRIAIARIGSWRFLGLYLLSALGGAAVFGLLSQGFRPMVGASGAIFGLAGGWLVWELRTARTEARNWRQPAIQTAKQVGFLVGLNFVVLWLQNGELAWQTHLGGFLTGAIIAALLPSTRSDF